MILGFKTKYERSLELEVEALEAEIELLREQLKRADAAKEVYFVASSRNASDIAKQYAEEITEEVHSKLVPILKKEVLNAIAGINWAYPSRVDHYKAPEFLVSESMELGTYRMHIKIPEINHVFQVCRY